jgi:hypothetical protein
MLISEIQAFILRATGGSYERFSESGPENHARQCLGAEHH